MQFKNKLKAIFCAFFILTTLLGVLAGCARSKSIGAEQSAQEVQQPDGQETIRSLVQSVAYKQESGELSFHTPEKIPQSTKLYIHVSGRLKTDEGGISWHEFEEETENFSWQLNQNYTATVHPKELDYFEITVGLADESADEIKYETIISIDNKGNIIIGNE